MYYCVSKILQEDQNLVNQLLTILFRAQLRLQLVRNFFFIFLLQLYLICYYSLPCCKLPADMANLSIIEEQLSGDKYKKDINSLLEFLLSISFEIPAIQSLLAQSKPLVSLNTLNSTLEDYINQQRQITNIFLPCKLY